MRVSVSASFALWVLIWGLAAPAMAQPKTLKKMTIPADASTEVRAQIERLLDKDPATRADAVMKLGGLGPKAAAALPFLVETARDGTKVPINGEEQSITALVSESLKETAPKAQPAALTGSAVSKRPAPRKPIAKPSPR